MILSSSAAGSGSKPAVSKIVSKSLRSSAKGKKINWNPGGV
jgi:hypothetical protein